MYEINGTDYELKYSTGRIETIERETGIAAFSFIANTAHGNFPTISTLISFFAYGLYNPESGTYCPAKLAKQFAKEYMEKNGYQNAVTSVIEHLQEDLGFLFQ